MKLLVWCAAFGLGLLGWGEPAWSQSDAEASCQANVIAPRLNTQRATIVMVLSPRMVYALHEWPRMAATAQQAGFQVHVVRDPRVPNQEWQAAVRAIGLASLAGVDAAPQSAAAACGLLNHSPATLVARCGRYHPWPVLGVMPDAPWVSTLRARVDSLKGDPC